MKYLLYGAFLLSLVGCHTTDTKITHPSASKVACESFKVISYDSNEDSLQTQIEIREHNEAYKAICTIR